jgi:hypothetical protein
MFQHPNDWRPRPAATSGIRSYDSKELGISIGSGCALVLTLDTTAGFGKRWRICRLSESKTKESSFQLIELEPTKTDVQRLIQIEREHAEAITG